MAIVVKYPTSRYWVAAFRDSSGRQHRRTTRETNRKRAQAIADKYERISKGKGDAQRVRQVMNEFFRDHYGEEIPLSSIRQYVLEWLATRKVETSPATNVIYDRSAQRFLSFLGANADKSLESVSRTLIADFRDSCTRQTTAGAANTDLKIVKAIFRSARREGYLLRDPAEGIKPIKSRDEATERRPLTISEIRSILAVADPEWQSLIRFGLFTGQRLGDLALLTWGQIDLDRCEIRLTARKTRKQVLIPIADPLRDHIIAIAHGDDPRAPVHPRAAASVAARKGTVATLSQQFVELLASVGLRLPHKHYKEGYRAGSAKHTGKRIQSGISFHSLRHSAVTFLKEAGVPDAVVMAMIGHETKAMSQHYTHVGSEALAKAAASMPVI